MRISDWSSDVCSSDLVARQLVYHAAWLAEQGGDAVREVSMVKALCGELVNAVTYDCVQFHGGAGYLRDSEIERMARDARIHPIGGGATEVMLEEIAKRWLARSEEHTSELQSLMRISYAVFRCDKNKNRK